LPTLRHVVSVTCFVILFTVAFYGADDASIKQKVDQVFAAYSKPDTPGCALGVIRNGDFVYERGYGIASLELNVPITPQSVFYLGSLSKQFTAASIVLAAEQGYLSLDDDVRKYFPELPSYGDTITLRQMLHHTSGLRDVLDLLELSGRNWEDIHPTAEVLDLIVRQKSLNFKPGDEYLYSNTNYFLLAQVIHRATGKPLSRFAEENIFKPLGMTHTSFHDDRSIVVPGRVAAYDSREGGGFRLGWSTNFEKVGDGGLMSTVDDLLLWDRNFYANKLGKGRLLHETLSRGVLNNGEKTEYAMGLRETRYRGLPIVEHGGALFGYRTELVRFPEQKFSVITLCNLDNSNPKRLAYQVADLYLDTRYPDKPLPPAAHVDTQPFVGLYRNPTNHSVVKVSDHDGAIEIQQRRFQPIGTNRFSALVEEQQIGFEPANAGGMRMTMSSADAAAQIFERFQSVIPEAEDIAKYAGEYVSDELQASYKFAVKDGRLTLTRNWQEPIVLEFNIHDEFRAPHDIAIVFRRDASGQIAGCDVFARRVRKVALFRKAQP
jgi:CubicO group peptidase (beta-lactamase class C family)